MEIERLGSPCRDRATVRVREAVVLVAVERYGLRCRDLAMAPGRSADQVSRWAGQASRRKAQDGAFRKRLEALDAAIAGASAAGMSGSVPDHDGMMSMKVDIVAIGDREFVRHVSCLRARAMLATMAHEAKIRQGMEAQALAIGDR